jgi:predicted nucleic acid-binding protein
MRSGRDELRLLWQLRRPFAIFCLTPARVPWDQVRFSPRNGPRSWSTNCGPAGHIVEPVAVVDAFDADVLIYAAAPDHELGVLVRALFPIEAPLGAGVMAGIGSVLLLPELLTKPLREGAEDELIALGSLLSRIVLLPADQATAEMATAFGASYGLRATDAVHLATAVGAGADRFITNNRADFPKSISEIAISYPEDLIAE